MNAMPDLKAFLTVGPRRMTIAVDVWAPSVGKLGRPEIEVRGQYGTVAFPDEEMRSGHARLEFPTQGFDFTFPSGFWEAELQKELESPVDPPNSNHHDYRVRVRFKGIMEPPP